MKSKIIGLFLIAALHTSLAQTTTTPEAVATLQKEAQSAADQETKSLAGDFAAKIAALSKSVEGNPTAQKQLESVVNAVLGARGPAAVEGLQKLATAKFTAEQTRLAKDVYNVGSAYVVKRNLGSLEGSQSHVSQIVSSLRKGEFANAVPSLKKIGENANLTQPQKDLVTSLMNSYAPGLKKVGDGLKGLPGLKQ